MRLTLLHPPHTAIGSRIPKENLPPFGLLCIGGPLIDAGHQVSLVNADLGPMRLAECIDAVLETDPDAILIGHSGSSSAHPTALELSVMIRAVRPRVKIIYGGVYPTYHWKDVLQESDAIDIIIRGEGEATTPAVIAALETASDLSAIPGIAYRDDTGQIRATAPAPVLTDLDAHRVGWELIDFDDYSYWGGLKSVILQFSRGCPHLCNYCGQRGFWTRWRHRDPVKLAREIAWLVREQGVELVNLADENPTSSRRKWKAFLEALIEENVKVTLIGSTRADDIVRDADLLPLYKKAGVLRFLLGLESTDEATLRKIRKGGTTTKDQQAIRLLRNHGMIGLCTFAVGFADERDRDFLKILRQLIRYDPDQIMSIYATPHRWTPFFGTVRDRQVIQPDLRRWDYKHQVVETPHIPAWRVFFWVKSIEVAVTLRPRNIWRQLTRTDPDLRHAMRWDSRMGRRVILHEVWQFLFRTRRSRSGTVAEFLGGAEQLPENAMARQSHK
ncbi:magnesium-protoporphyrin IX monomethyl ester anaerobic oxidative cyclase [Ruegeria sp. HKCCD8929]|uniref:magnesium-protoporphyrin IX monomethyl ester anaerobic oxidative cyclase n=1 Tax=Ruegeria sp. HKCCD8929 TaxID=2683006 RepID=UPI001487C996|nr:magnesium-protoporphyrin IX monomethyl ester anaerobic oxidative cyclase [Ruegeria sp. HKCCD8929]